MLRHSQGGRTHCPLSGLRILYMMRIPSYWCNSHYHTNIRSGCCSKNCSLHFVRLMIINCWHPDMTCSSQTYMSLNDCMFPHRPHQLPSPTLNRRLDSAQSGSQKMQKSGIKFLNIMPITIVPLDSAVIFILYAIYFTAYSDFLQVIISHKTQPQ